MNEGAISEYSLERYALGELPPEEAAEVERAAASDPDVRAALDRLKTSGLEILAHYPPSTFKTALQARLETRNAGTKGLFRRRYFAFASAGAVLVAAAVLIIPQIKGLRNSAVTDSERERTVIKGDAGIDLTKTQLLVYRKSGDSAELLNDGKEAGPGVLLQLGYVAAAEPYGVILSIDGRGSVTRHFPSEEGGSTLLSLGTKSLLPNAIELDDAPRFERFFLVTSAAPIDVADVLARAAELGSNPVRARRSNLDLPPGLKQSSLLILKGEDSR